MKEVIKISIDGLCELLYELVLPSDISRKGHYITVEKSNAGALKDEFFKSIIDSDCVERGYYCPTCCGVYEKDNGEEACDDCLES